MQRQPAPPSTVLMSARLMSRQPHIWSVSKAAGEQGLNTASWLESCSPAGNRYRCARALPLGEDGLGLQLAASWEMPISPLENVLFQHKFCLAEVARSRISSTENAIGETSCVKMQMSVYCQTKLQDLLWAHPTVLSIPWPRAPLQRPQLHPSTAPTTHSKPGPAGSHQLPAQALAAGLMGNSSAGHSPQDGASSSRGLSLLCCILPGHVSPPWVQTLHVCPLGSPDKCRPPPDQLPLSSQVSSSSPTSSCRLSWGCPSS